YEGVVVEYWNDLTVRDTLEDLIRHAPPLLKEKVLAIVEPLDARFRAATYPLSGSIFPPLDAHEEQGWWWFRGPKRLSFSTEAAPYYQPDWEQKVPELFGGRTRRPADGVTPGAVVTVR